MAEKASTAVIQEACIQGVSTRTVDDLVQAMGMSGISKDQISRLYREIDDTIPSFLDRPLEGDWPYPLLSVNGSVRMYRRAASRSAFCLARSPKGAYPIATAALASATQGCGRYHSGNSRADSF